MTEAGASALEFRSVCFQYPPHPWDPSPKGSVLDDITLSVRPGQRLGILGPNGGGKSTLLKLALGLLDGHSGEIRVHGLSPSEARRRRLIGYLPQRIEAVLDFPISVRQAVAMGLTAGLGPLVSVSREQMGAIDRALTLVGMSDLSNHHVGSLSGGQLQRVMIARALASGPRLLVLDEPTVGIDVGGQEQFATLIERLHQHLDLTTLIVTHDLRIVAAACDRVACLRRTLHYHDAPGGLTPEVLAEVFSHDVEEVFGTVHVDAHTAADCDDPTHQHRGARGADA